MMHHCFEQDSTKHAAWEVVLAESGRWKSGGVCFFMVM